MKLRSLALSRFKKFTSPVCLDGIGDGLNVVVGANEMGKSTLLDALRAALFERHSSRAEPIEALQNDRDPAGPMVALTFENTDGLYRIEKRFMKKPYAHLTCPDGHRLDGEAAEDALQRLLGFNQAGRTGAKPETLGMWSVLWVQQGRSFGALHLPDAARGSLQGALESEVGDVLGGRRGHALLEAVEQAHREFFTTGGNPRGDYKRQLSHVQTLQDELAILEGRREELAETFAELDEAEEKLAELETGDRDRVDETELADARTRRNELAELETRIRAAESETELRSRDLTRAEQAAAEREKLKQAACSAEQAVRQASTERTRAIDRRADVLEGLDALRQAVRDAEDAAEAAGARATLNRRVLSVVDREATVRALEDQCEKAREAEKRRQCARLAAAAILVTEDALERIRCAAKALETVNARRDAQATTITFDMDPDARSGVEVDDKPLSPESLILHVIETTEIAIADRGRITIGPACKNHGKLTAHYRDARLELETALSEAKVTTLEEAERQHTARGKLVGEAELAGQGVALYAPATREREAGAEALAEAIEVQRRILLSERNDLGLAELPPRQEAETHLKAAEAECVETREAVGIARAKLAGPEKTLRDVEVDLGGAIARHGYAIDERARLLADYQRSEAALPEGALQNAIGAARSRLVAQQATLTSLASKRGDATLPQLDARIGRLEKAIEERRKKRAGLREKLATLKSRIGGYAAAGIDEEIANKQREIERCERECEVFAREAETLELLLSTLRDAERKAKERYLRPVLKRVQPYLSVMLPGARIMIDENLEVIGLVREADYEESFTRLSMGTQEQISVLVRLAFAEMLAEQGHPASIILDDALVFSDDRRMKLMFDILNMAARRVQILVLTCREQLFEGLGAQQLSLRCAASEELESV